MATSIDLFDYHLPEERIAQSSVEPRDASRLFMLDRYSGETTHGTFRDILTELQAGDVLVMNNTKVFKARLQGRVVTEDADVQPRAALEIFLLRHDGKGVWQALIGNARRVRVGDHIDLGGLSMTVTQKRADWTMELETTKTFEEVITFTETQGSVPLPPYVQATKDTADSYQTAYAAQVGSVAAPTAGFHFTPELMERLKEKRVQFEFITLHVGLGTFQPVKAETLEAHTMHQEWVHVSADVATRINQAKAEGRRVVAVGTTSVRTLEGVAAQQIDANDLLPYEGYTGDVNLFITPGFPFRVIDGLITNFHLPKSTLLVLVSAFAGREHVLRAYKEAVEKEYRFYSFGDAMFIR